MAATAIGREATLDPSPAVLAENQELNVWARSNAAHSGTHIRRRNRKCSDDAVAVLRSLAVAIRTLAT